MNNAKIGTALIGGYLLGRRKKGKAALGLALAMAARRAKAGDLAEALTPVLGNLNRQARTELASATKAAVGSVVNAQADHLADALHRRTLGLQGQRGDEDREDEEPREEEPREEEEPPREAEEPHEARERREAEEERPRTKKAAHRPSSRPRVRESDDD
ncbi:hypothetical protein SSP24_36960 [Streptomyces spinoverrucosus]|uniref:DNA primase n=1 Tax=Streptomyces spinoverrucosus TaxID=284043 RepID=A0A4Y3VK04_9ACTN|nr:hypothetical protein [Streptomyces spinoverrucosus]GEC06041.1 hypothetical protein SSP24_36960 [Streptomyces spinoverrucosus]GHB73674.1 hypothetical protein GCM10010397_49910 [Streptomyces spinoverrucosus]